MNLFQRSLGLFGLLAGLGLATAWSQAPAAPGRGRAELDLAQAAEKSGDQPAALQHYQAALESGELTKAGLARVHHRIGSIRGGRGESEAAIASFTRCLELDPANGSAHSLRGYLRGGLGAFDAAEEDHRQAVKLAAGEKWEDYLPWVLQHYADLCRRRGEFVRALALCQEALNAHEYPVVYFRRAWIHLDMGQPELARLNFERFRKDSGPGADLTENFWPDERAALARLKQLPGGGG